MRLIGQMIAALLVALILLWGRLVWLATVAVLMVLAWRCRRPLLSYLLRKPS